MTEQKPKSLPELEHLEMDWGYTPANPQGKRAHLRLENRALARLFNNQRILVKVATATGAHTGVLANISEGGLAVRLEQHLFENQAVRIGFFLGSEKIITRAVVRHSHGQEGRYSTGIKFVGLEQRARQAIAGLYSAHALRHCL